MSHKTQCEFTAAHSTNIYIQMQNEKRVRKAPVRFQAPDAILKKKTKKSPSQVKHCEALVAANAIKRQEAIEEREQAASRLFDEVGNKALNATQRKVNLFFRNGEGFSVRYPVFKK